MKVFSSALAGYLFACITVVLWASFVLLSRAAGGSGLNPFDLAALRFGVASLVLLPAWWIGGRPAIFDQRLCVLGLLGGLGYALGAYTGLHIAPASHGAVLLSGILPFFMVVMSWLVLGETPGSRRFVSLGFIGVGVLSVAIHSMGNLAQSWHGDLILVASSAIWALYTVLVKRWQKTPWEVTVGVALVAAILYMPVYLLFLPKAIHSASWGVILGQGFFHGILVVVVAMWLFLQAMARLGPNRLGAVMALVPALAGLGAVFILGESSSWLLLTGFALTSAGAWLGSRPGS